MKILGKRGSLLLIVDVAGPTVYGDFGGLTLKYTVHYLAKIFIVSGSSYHNIHLYGFLSFSISDFEIGGGKKRKKLSKLLGNVTKVSKAFHSILDDILYAIFCFLITYRIFLFHFELGNSLFTFQLKCWHVLPPVVYLTREIFVSR